MEGGYVKIYRSLMDKGYYKDSEYVHLWVHLIMKASYQKKDYLFNGKIEHLEPGQFITGRNALVQETGINRSKVERILGVFKSEQQIEQQTFNKFRIITILNWDIYQISEQQIEQQVSNKRATNEQPVSTIKKEKKEKNINTISGTFIKPTLEEITTYCAERKNGIDPEYWLDHYNSNGWKVGKNSMKDWKATIRTWEKRNKINGEENTKQNKTAKSKVIENVTCPKCGTSVLKIDLTTNGCIYCEFGRKGHDNDK